MHPVRCYGDDDNQEAIDRFYTFSFSSCCKAVMDPKWQLPYGEGHDMEEYLDIFRKKGITVQEQSPRTPFHRFVFRLTNQSYSIKQHQYFLMVKLDGNESPGWSFYINTTPERFADLLFEFDSLHGWLMDSYRYYVDAIHKQKMIDQIEAITKAAKSSQHRWW